MLPWHPESKVLEKGGSVSEFVKHHLLGLNLTWEALMKNMEKVEAVRKGAHDAKYRTTVPWSTAQRDVQLFIIPAFL